MQLRSHRLLLREQVLEDAEAANVYERDPEVTVYQFHDVRTLEESRANIQRSIDSAQKDPRIVYDLAIALKDEPAHLIGRVGFEIKSAEQKEAMIWWVVRKSDWGKGYATEAAREVLRFAFEDLSLHRVYADLDPRNIASSKICEKLAMRREAHFIENIFVKGEWCDTWIYAMLDREWKSGRR